MQVFEDERIGWFPAMRGEKGDIEIPDALYFRLVKAHTDLKEVEDEIDRWRQENSEIQETGK